MSGLTLFAQVLRYKSLPECVGKRVIVLFFHIFNLIAQKKLLHYKQNGSGGGEKYLSQLHYLLN